jgi:hypothetical protein
MLKINRQPFQQFSITPGGCGRARFIDSISIAPTATGRRGYNAFSQVYETNVRLWVCLNIEMVVDLWSAFRCPRSDSAIAPCWGRNQDESICFLFCIKMRLNHKRHKDHKKLVEIIIPLCFLCYSSWLNFIENALNKASSFALGLALALTSVYFPSFLRNAAASSGTIFNASPTTPYFAILKIGASGSLLIATIMSDELMPAMC